MSNKSSFLKQNCETGFESRRDFPPPMWVAVPHLLATLRGSLTLATAIDRPSGRDEMKEEFGSARARTPRFWVRQRYLFSCPPFAFSLKFCNAGKTAQRKWTPHWPEVEGEWMFQSPGFEPLLPSKHCHTKTTTVIHVTSGVLVEILFTQIF